jgi:peptide/nickel transport system substrate-binding protein
MTFSRRDFLKTGAAGAALAAAPNALSATPKRGGVVRVGFGSGSTTDSLDPGPTDSTFMQVGLFGALHNALTEITPDGDIVGELAEEWEASPDARVWTFRLRRGVEFHNGRAMEAKDVIASFNHHRGKDSTSAAKSILAPIKEIRADGKHTVVFELETGNADFPFITNDYHIVIAPAEADGKVDWTKGVGAGPFKLDEFEPGVRMNFSRHPNYWKSGLPYFDGLRILALKDSAARTNALVTGEVDVINRVEPKTAARVGAISGVELLAVAGTQHYTIPMHTDVSPYSDNNVRLALKYAIDREAMMQTVSRGYGSLWNDHPIAPSNRYFNKDIPQRKYDPDRAKFYLKQAGLSSLNVELSAADAAFAGAVDAGVLFKEHAAKAGININILRESDDGYWSNVWLVKPFVFCYWSGRPTEDWMFTTAYAEGAEWNDTNLSHPRFNQLLTEARAELNDSLRREMYYEMQQILHDEGGTIIPMGANYINALKGGVMHPAKVAGNWDFDGFKATERWWMA